MQPKFVVRGQKVTPEKVAKAKGMRHNMTAAEKILWQNLRANRLGGWHFRRQQILYGYIVDFYCHATSLIIEIDGEIHEEQGDADKEREAALQSKGFRVIRFHNREIEHDLDNVLHKILAACNQALNPPPLIGDGLGERSQGA